MKKIIIVATVLVLIVIGFSIDGYITNKSIKEKHQEVILRWEAVEKQEKNTEVRYEAISDFNAAVEEYNITIKKFPNNIYAKIAGNKEVMYFVADSQEIPQVEF